MLLAYMVQEAAGYVLNGFAPESYSISASVLEGAILGTLLFIIVIYDLQARMIYIFYLLFYEIKYRKYILDTLWKWFW